jgi:phospholipid transport system substrate-binding protein
MVSPQYGGERPVQRTMKSLSIRLVLALGIAAGARPALAAGDDAVGKPVRTLINAVRYHKDALALTHLDGEAQARTLLGAEWDKATPAQRTQFVTLFHELFAAMAFPRLREDFVHLETAVYEKAEVKGDAAELGSTLVILHPMKKQEIRVRYRLVRVKAWKLVDVTVLGDKSMLTNIRDDQVAPILKEGGLPHLLDLMRKRAAELRAKK